MPLVEQSQHQSCFWLLQSIEAPLEAWPSSRDHRSQPAPTPLHPYANKHNTAAATVTLPYQELCEGGDWFDQLLGGGAFSEAQAARAIRSVLKTLSYCHSLGVAHRQAWGQAYHGMEKDCVAFHQVQSCTT